MSARRTLYPASEASRVLQLDVGDGHRLHVEEAGPADATPIVFLHGGPGSGCKSGHRQYFDPKRWRTVLFDQRGCNRSTPLGCTLENTTWHLVADMERIRKRLDIEQWVVFGGSWGATLGLAYAQAHPERVLGLILRGSFLARDEDVQWFFGRDGARHFFPDAFERFHDALQISEDTNILEFCYRTMHGEDREAQERVATAWSQWSTRVVMYAMQAYGADTAPTDMDRTIAEVCIETHYAWHAYWLEDRPLLANLDRLPDVPIQIIHGRRDLTCLPSAAWEIHRRLPNSKLEYLHEAGHLAGEAAMVDALVRATDEFARLVNPAR